MRFPSDNNEEMLRSVFTDQDIELLLSGSHPESSQLMVLVPVVAMLRAEGERPSSARYAEQFGAQAAAIARTAFEAEGKARQSRQQSRPQRSLLIPRLAGVLAAVLVFGTTGVAVAADGAAPGDPLYGVDRALENIGIGAGHADERIEEANRLVGLGRAQEALEHVSEAFDQAEQEGEDITDLIMARRAVEEAAELLPGEPGGESAEVVQENVEELLRYIKENMHEDVGADGRDFGQRVAYLARLIALNEERGNSGASTDTSTTNVTEPDDRNGNTGNGEGNNGTGNNGTGNNGTGNNGDNGNEGTGNKGGNINPGTGNGTDGALDDSPSETAPGRGNRP